MRLGEFSITESEKYESNDEISVPESEAAEHPASDESLAEGAEPEETADDADSSLESSSTFVNPNEGNQNIERSREIALAAAIVASQNGGRDIKVLDMTEHTPMFDYFVIASGSSRRQLHAMSEEIDHKLEDDLKDKRANIDGYDESRWIVLDYSTVVIHLFDDETRAYYSLESLWADATELDLTGLIEINES